ncbi:MAG: thioredoxin [Actinobacteria bacterium]|nr:thioredoxin [Actinomycetota bacterium]NBY15733.1 thioredoxin [Actinomycetota bacterium]
MDTGLKLAVITLAVSTVIGIVMHFRSGHIRKTIRDLQISESDLGKPLGQRATFIQFSSAFCQPCRATKLLLGSLIQNAEGIGHIEIDAESHLDLVRRLHVTRTPTTLVVDGKGRIVGKAVGVPKKQEVLATIEALSGN